MVGFFKLKNNSLADQRETGQAIIKVSKSAFKNTATSEWKKFNDDTRGWLHANGYRYEGPNAGPNGEIPPEVEIVPVYDSPNRMHVRIPWHEALTDSTAQGGYYTYTVPEEQVPASYRLQVILARYFMRHCR